MSQSKLLFQQTAFMRFWYARLVGGAANQMLMVAVGWQMYALTNSAWDLGLIGLFQFFPALLLALPAGHLVDRWNRAHIFAAALFVQFFVALGLLLAVYQGASSRELLLGLSILLGTARAFQIPSQQAIVPLLVPAELLPSAAAFSSSGMQVAMVGGPALGGFLYALGVDVVYAVCAILFAIGTLFALWVRYPNSTPPASKEPVTLHTLLAGVRFIAQHKVILGAISIDLFAVLLGGAVALLPIYAKDILHTGPWGLGLLRAAPAIGALLMSAYLTRWPLERHVGRRLLYSVAIFGAATVVFGLSTSFYLSLFALMITGAADIVSVIVRISLVQIETPDAMRGRVSAVNSIFVGASNQLGEFESGATAALLGPVGSVLFGGVGAILIAGIWFKWFPALANKDGFEMQPKA